MNSAILTILTLSISGSVLVLILLALRPVLKNKVSKTFQYYIWLLILLRLALPLSLDGSIMNQIISQTFMRQVPVVTFYDGSGITVQAPQTDGQNTAGEGTPSGTSLDPDLSTVSEQTRVNVWKFAEEHLVAIWLLGASVHFGWFIVTYLRFSRKIRRTSVRPHPADLKVFAKLRGNANVRLACNPYIDTPLLIGFPSPCIIVPHLAFAANGMGSELQHILRHELTHYRRRDLLYKWFAVFVSSLHWFNPLMILIRREISHACELSCDEAVIRSMNVDQRRGYGETLLSIASNKRLPAGVVTTTMCEEKRELKERLESIMSYKSKSVIMVVLSVVLTLMLAGCSVALGAAKGTNQTPGDEASPLPTATLNQPSQTTATSTPNAPTSPSATVSDSKNANSPVLEAYKAILQNKAKFYSTDSKKELYLNDLLTNKEIYITTFKVTRFAILDMDGDKVSEVVLELSVGSEPQFFEVLHYSNGTVRGYLISYRGLQGLKADGTFAYSSGAADSGWGKLKFGSSAYDTSSLGYSESGQGGITYYIDDKQVTKQSYDSFTKEQSGKKAASWYAFSEKNIELYL